jgi:TrmH family RNA methyltransferase
MGATFKQQITSKNIKEITELKKSGVKFIGTSSNSDLVSIKKADLSNSIIILGNEGKGISKQLLSLCDEIVTIPLSLECESINVAVAASIIMWEACGKGM